MSVAATINLQRVVETDGLPPTADFVRWARAALAESKPPLAAHTIVTIRIVAETESQALNSTYRDIGKATNVLAFPAAAIATELVEVEPELGDLVICAAVVAREAAEQSKSLTAHFAHMTVHGCLHLLGLDHQTEQQAAEMESLEVQVLHQLGFPDPYMNNEQDLKQA